jgi:hypothetical protein
MSQFLASLADSFDFNPALSRPLRALIFMEGIDWSGTVGKSLEPA